MARENRIDFTPKLCARFWAKVNKDGPVPLHCPELGPCWVWTASFHLHGYGQFGASAVLRSLKAPRVAYAMEVGPIPDGLGVLHHCDNPACVNPAHLFLGDHGANMRDARDKGRLYLQRESVDRKGANHGRAKLADADVLAMRANYAAGETARSLAAKYGIDVTHAQRIIYGVNWSHLPVPSYTNRPRRGN